MPLAGPSRVLIDLRAYKRNLGVIRTLIPEGCRMAAVVKANAYGHGAFRIAHAAAEAGADMLAVAFVAEGVALRKAGITTPILVMVHPGKANLTHAVMHDLTVTLSDVPTAERLNAAAAARNTTADVHLMVDTGMGRGGCSPEEVVATAKRIAVLPRCNLAGLATHFSVAEETQDTFTGEQLAKFGVVREALKEAGISFNVTNAANSAGILYHDACFDMVRPGLMTYGVLPGGPAKRNELGLEPVMRWETAITLIRDMPVGATIGYGRTYRVEQPMRAALLPVGYADGYPWALQNRCEVLIHGFRCPVRGRISMDQIVVDITAVPEARPGDTAVLLGADKDERITAEELADRAGAIPYEILTGIGRRSEAEYLE